MRRSPFHRLPSGGRIDRTRPVSFSLDGRTITGCSGDTLASALLANGVAVVGRGFMRGQQKMNFLPEPQTDFIYSVISEEFGLIGATLVLIAFCVIAWRGWP